MKNVNVTKSTRVFDCVPFGDDFLKYTLLTATNIQNHFSKCNTLLKENRVTFLYSVACFNFMRIGAKA